MIKVNDLVTRISHGNDVIFRVTAIQDNKVYLKGEIVRLVADAEELDLKPYDNKNKVKLTLPNIKKETNLITGKILHIDGDEYYLKKAMQAYQAYGIQAYGYFMEEENMPKNIVTLLQKHHPDILVITGHDSLKNKSDLFDINSYQNSIYYIDSVLEARKLNPNKDDLIIIAGACQSYYEKLIDAGANFASSPKRNNIHLLDPVILASICACTKITEYVNVESALMKTVARSMGGIDTRGTARVNYLRTN